MIISDSVQILLLLALWAAAINYFAWKKRFYTWHPRLVPPVSFKDVASVFVIYLFALLIAAPYLSSLFLKFSSQIPSFGIIVAVQFFIILGTMAGIFFYCRSQARETFIQVVKNPQSKSSLWFDATLGLLTWFIAFPIVAFLSQLFDLLLYLIFGLESYEQVAVRYLKSTLASPSLTILALISILIIAPTIEEFLFRGTLQTYFKRKLGAKAAILLAAAFFAMFHYSPSQGLGNLSLLPSLFAFGCYLGFIYERQGSLLASIALHATFNLASALRILFSPESA